MPAFATTGCSQRCLPNRNVKAIAEMAAVWRFETESGGRSFRHSRGMLSPRPLLLSESTRILEHHLSRIEAVHQ
jgi:hypothetical protein